MKKKFVLCSSLFVFLFSSLSFTGNIKSVSAEKINNSEVCNINVEYRDFTEALYLDGAGKYLMDTNYTVNREDKIYMPNDVYVKEALRIMLRELNKYGIDLDQLAKEKVRYDLVNADMDGIMGHAFVAYPGDDPTIYLYGKYRNIWDKQQTYETTIHEFGHYIEKVYLNDSDRLEYRKLRNIPESWNNSSSRKWEERFEEIFAEDFKTLFLDEYIYKVNMNMPTDIEKENILLFITDIIKRKQIENVDGNNEYKYILSNKNIIKLEDVVICDNQIDIFLTESLNGNDVLSWTIHQIKDVNKEWYDRLQMFDVSYSMYEENGIYTLNLDNVNKKDMIRILNYFNSFGQHLIIEEKEKYLNEGLNKKIVNKNKELEKSLKHLYKRKVLSDQDILNIDFNKELTRGEAAHLLFLNLKLNNKNSEYNFSNNMLFNDITEDNPYRKSIFKLKELGIFNGKTSEYFGVNDYLTREQMAAILNRAYNFKEKSDIKNNFKDFSKVSDSFKNDIETLYDNKIMLGTIEGYVNPKSNVTIGQFILMLDRSYMLSVNEDDWIDYASEYNEWLSIAIDRLNSIENRNLNNKDYIDLWK